MGLFDRYKKSNLNESKDWSSAMENNNANIDRLARLRTQVNIDPVMEEAIDSTEKADKNAKEVFTKLAKDAKDITPKDPGTGKKVTIKPYTEKLSLDESLFKESWTSFGGSWRDQTVKRVNYEEDDISDIAYELMNWYGEYFEGWEGPDIKDALYGLDGERIPGSDCPIIFTMEESEEDEWDEDEEYDESLSNVNEDYNTREYSDKLYDMIEDDMVDAKKIAEDLIYWCSEDDIKEYMRVNDLLLDDEDMDESLKETKSKQPKYWNSMFTTKVIDAYKDGKLTLDNIDEWEKKYNGGTKPTNLGTKEILTYHMNTGKDPRNESLEKKSLSEDWALEPGKTFRSKSNNEITIKEVIPYISEYDGTPSLRIKYDYVLNNGKFGSSECSAKDLFNMLNESVNLLEYASEDEEDDEYTVYDLLNDRLFGYGINKSNFRVKWKFAEIEPTVKTKDGKLKRGYFYPTIHQDELVTGKSDDRRAFTEDGVGVFVHDEDEASLAKKCAEELNLDFIMKKLVRPYNGFNYIATIKVSDDIQEMPIKDYMESIGKSMSDLLRGKGDKIKSNFKDSKNYQSRKANKEQQETTEE